jgi:transcription antitermination factor NusG
MLDAAHNPALASPQPDTLRARSDAPCGRNWLVCYTHPQAERWADQSLRQRGYQVFLPLAIVRRRDNAIRSLFHRVEAPAFPRYLFALNDGPWTPLRYCPGIADLVWQCPGKPGTVTEAAISALRGVLAEAATLQRKTAQWAPGALVTLANGSLAGHPAVVLDVSRDTARVSVLLFGALREVKAPIDCLVTRD